MNCIGVRAVFAARVAAMAVLSFTALGQGSQTSP
jgi:hypothetical protein